VVYGVRREEKRREVCGMRREERGLEKGREER